MISQLAKKVTDSQPAVVMATVLAYACMNHRWPAVVAVFVVLQLGILLSALATRHPRVRQAGVRFLARASAITQPMTEPAPRSRPQLRLVP
jgi:hypothetical protein